METAMGHGMKNLGFEGTRDAHIDEVVITAGGYKFQPRVQAVR